MIEAILGLFPSDLAMQACQEHADLFKKTAGNVWRVNYPPISNDLESDTDVRTTNEIALLPSLQVRIIFSGCFDFIHTNQLHRSLLSAMHYGDWLRKCYM